MKRFFTSLESESPKLTRKERKKIIGEFNEKLHQRIEQTIQEDYQENYNKLKEAGFSDEQIETFFKDLKREAEIKLIEEYKKKLREIALAQSSNSMPPPAPPPSNR